MTINSTCSFVDVIFWHILNVTFSECCASSVNPRPAYPLVSTAYFGPMVYPFPQNDSRLIQPPSHVNPHPAYSVANIASFRPMVHSVPQFLQNDFRLLQAPSQVLVPQAHFSTPSVPPAVRDTLWRYKTHLISMWKGKESMEICKTGEIGV
jgi:hypothetical protein